MLDKFGNAKNRGISNKVGTFRFPIPCCPLLEESQAFKHGRLSRGNFPAPIFAIVDHFVVNNCQTFGNWKLESLAPSHRSNVPVVSRMHSQRTLDLGRQLTTMLNIYSAIVHTIHNFGGTECNHQIAQL